MTEDEIILTHILQCRLLDLALRKSSLTSSQQQDYDEYRRRRANGEPLQYILGTCNFMGLELAVNPSVLIPRPETEQLVDAAVRITCHSRDKRENPGAVTILDLGTGCGNIAIALAKFIPGPKIVTVDVSAQALDLARANAQKHGVQDRIQFVQADISVILSEAKDLNKINSLRDSSARYKNDDGLFDLIISNPPYIPTSQLSRLPRDVQQEPKQALDGGEDGLKFIRIIIKYSPSLLRRGGCLMMEFGDGQAESIKKLVEDQNIFSAMEIIKDLAGRERVLRAIL